MNLEDMKICQIERQKIYQTECETIRKTSEEEGVYASLIRVIVSLYLIPFLARTPCQKDIQQECQNHGAVADRYDSIDPHAAKVGLTRSSIMQYRFMQDFFQDPEARL
jgi:hypothetical protein